ncbi:MAG: MogA/MoaB family molybdenum cofactor biosynthesis protein [Thermoplasmatota archaeon]
MGHKEHKRAAPDDIRCKVITVSDTRDKETDESGKLIRELLEEHNIGVCSYSIIPDEMNMIKEELGTKDADAYIINGGTGISSRDVTPDAVRDIVDKVLPGFGEMFRSLSYEEIGSAAYLSRAIAGVNDKQVVFALPGSKAAVELGMEKLILPELGHLVYEVNK